MIPNIAMDNTVEKHINALAASGSADWQPSGVRHTEWSKRKESVCFNVKLQTESIESILQEMESGSLEACRRGTTGPASSPASTFPSWSTSAC